MPIKKLKIKYVPLKNCFCVFSASNFYHFPSQSCVKVIDENDSVFYLSVGPQNITVLDNELGISNLFAKALNLNENTLVQVSLIDKLPKVESLTLSVRSNDDYQILESFADKVQMTLLNHLSVVSLNQKVVIWVSSNLSLTANIDEVYPVSPGRLENFTKVVVEPTSKNNVSKNQSISDVCRSRIPLTDSEYILKMSENEFIPQFFRLHSLDDLKNCNKITDDSNSLNIFDVFISEKNVPIRIKTAIEKRKRNVYVCLKIISPPKTSSHGFLDENFSIQQLVVRLILIKQEEDFVIDFPIMFANRFIFENYHLKVGSKVIICNRIENLSSNVKNIIIMTKHCYLDEIESKFKQCLADNCKNLSTLLNADFKFPLDKNNKMYCSLKFEPSSLRYCLLNNDSLRNIKYTIVEEDLRIETEDQNEEIKFYSQIGNFNVISDDVAEILKHTLSCNNNGDVEGIIITGKPGSGKTSLLNYFCRKLSELPFRFHLEKVNCNALKGKTADSLIRVFHSYLMKAIYFQPSVLLFDDFQVICGKTEKDLLTQESVLINRASEIIRNLIFTYLPQNSIQIIASCENVFDLNECLMPARGKRIFCHSFKIDDLNQKDRVSMLKFLFENKNCLEDGDFEEISSQMDGYVVQDLIDFANKTVFEMIKENAESVSVKHCEQILSKFTTFSLKDVNIHSPGNKDFSDVGGLEDVKSILIESVLWPLQYPTLFDSAPLRLQSGVLLYGPPGTGKTLLAGAAAKQCKIRLIAVKGPELLSKFIGASEQAVRNIFEKAQNAKPCILFFDEFDSLAPRRGHDSTGVTDRVVNQLLTQLDGVESLNGVCVLAATSRPDLLDPALLRPGRLDKQIFCPNPDFEARLSILKALSKSLILEEDVNLEKIAKLTEKYSGADIQGVLSTAHLSAVEEIIESDKVVTSEELKIQISQRYLEDALKSSRPSLKDNERRKYDEIYRKFQGTSNVFKLHGSVKQKATMA